ncbi:MAG: HAD family phosphatase [Myxococcota bacterium]
MSVRAALFDIGGVLEITPSTGWRQKWETRLCLRPGELDERLAEVWRAGAVGRITEQEVSARIGAILSLDARETAALLHDGWEEYLGQPNFELIAYFRGLRPRLRTGIISNSFVGAREREHARYAFAELCDVLIYSHEVGMEKPDSRIFELALSRLEVRAEEAVFVDDVEMHVDAARKLGMHAVLFTDAARAIAEIEALRHRVA